MASFTRKSIMESFLKLLDERPLNKIFIKDIVEDCGINRNTFYYHFADLPDLVEAVMKDEVDRIIEECADVETLEQCLDVAVQMTTSHRRAVYHLYSSANRDIVERYLLDICGYVAQNFVDTLAAGKELQPDDRAGIIQFYKCECFGQIIDWLNHGMNTDLEKQFYRQCELHRGMTEELIRRSMES